MRKILRERGEFDALQYDGTNIDEFEEAVGRDCVYGYKSPCDAIDLDLTSNMRLYVGDWLVWRYKSDGTIAAIVVQEEDFDTLFREAAISSRELWKKAKEFREAHPDYKPDEIMW